MFEYEALITNVVDGDTMDFIIDLGFGIAKKDRLRLYGCNTPEIRGEERLDGLRVKQAVEEMVLNKKVRLQTHKWKGKYGRYVAKVLVKTGILNGDGKESQL
jgi:micrococcal nuclease